jgi:radical SAM protein with 4Fe4S-binding SPASM domain
MPILLYKKIIDEIAIESPNAEVWMAYYGEALLLKYKIYYMIRYAKDKRLTNVVLNSNAMLLDQEMSEMLIDSGLDRFIISMDGFSKETYERIRVGGIYEKVFNNTLRFLETLKSKKLDKPQFEMQFSVMDENIHELEEFNKFWTEKGAYVKNRPKASWAGRIEAPNLDPSIERVPCKWALNHGAILWDGSLVACGVDSEGLFIAGNINNLTIKEIWNTTHKEFRQIHLEKRWSELPDVCKGCLDWQTTERSYLEPGKKKV